MVLCGRLPTFVCFLELCRLCIFGFTSNNFLQNTKNLLGDDHNQEMKIFNFGFSILVKTKVFVAFVIAYSNQVLHVKKNPNIVVYSRFLVMQLQMKKAILSICFKTYFKMNLIYLLFHRRRARLLSKNPACRFYREAAVLPTTPVRFTTCPTVCV